MVHLAALQLSFISHHLPDWQCGQEVIRFKKKEIINNFITTSICWGTSCDWMLQGTATKWTLCGDCVLRNSLYRCNINVYQKSSEILILHLLKCQNRVVRCIISPTVITFWSAESERFAKLHHGKLRGWAFPAKAEGTKHNSFLRALSWHNIIHRHVRPPPCL